MRRDKHIVWPCTCVLLVLWACGEAEVVAPKEYPYVLMTSAILKDEGVALTAEIIDLGQLPINSHGFVWNNERATLDESYAYHFQMPAKLGKYTYVIPYDSLTGGSIYYVRPVLSIEDFDVYGPRTFFEP